MKFLVTESQYKFLLKEQPTTSTAAAASKTGGGSVGKTTQQTKPQQPATNKDDSGISYQDYLKTRGDIPTYNYQDSLRANTKVMTPTTTPVPATKPTTPQTQQPQQGQQTGQPQQQPTATSGGATNQPAMAEEGDKKWIGKAVKGGEGKFTAKAKAAGKSVAAFAKEKAHGLCFGIGRITKPV